MSTTDEPTGPTCVVYHGSTISGGPSDQRACWHTRAQAESFAKWLPPSGCRFERCTHIPVRRPEARP